MFDVEFACNTLGVITMTAGNGDYFRAFTILEAGNLCAARESCAHDANANSFSVSSQKICRELKQMSLRTVAKNLILQDGQSTGFALRRRWTIIHTALTPQRSELKSTHRKQVSI